VGAQRRKLVDYGHGSLLNLVVGLSRPSIIGKISSIGSIDLDEIRLYFGDPPK
jgi:hypothetical protein